MKKTEVKEILNGIGVQDRKKIAQGLSHLLADSYTLYLQTHAFHWNVEGPMFNTLHLMFMDQYNEQWLALDMIAERIRALDFFAPGSYKEFAALTSIAEVAGVPEAMTMVSILAQGHASVASTARKLLPVAEAANDQVTVDLLTQRLQVHEKTNWMLRALLK